MSEGYSVTRLVPKHVNFVRGPNGFTESFSDHTVDVLVRIGLIEYTGSSISDNWVYSNYRATGRKVEE